MSGGMGYRPIFVQIGATVVMGQEWAGPDMPDLGPHEGFTDPAAAVKCRCGCWHVVLYDVRSYR